MRVLVTGSSGHLAKTVIPLVEARGHTVVLFDLPSHDIRDEPLVSAARNKADFCIHLAGMKYADRAEDIIEETVDTNVLGTSNIVRAFGPNMVLASTCKAADPETVYGCSKLIAERLVLRAGGRVVRFVNVLGSAGSVTEIWDAIPAPDPLPVTDATRLFMTHQAAALLVLDTMGWPSGRYAPATPRELHMRDLVWELHPGREACMVPLRKGDRQRERLLAACETSEPWTEEVVRIIGQHDPYIEGTTDAAVVQLLRRG